MTQTSNQIQNFGKSVAFFGSGPVAARSLELLLKHEPVEAVVTKPRAAHHRGNVPVLEVAESHNLKVFEVSTKKELAELFNSRPVNSELGIVIDFGIIISKDVIDYFPLGIINSHFSLLPQWRGADPISFAILSGQKKTGVSLMLIDEGMDTGPILAHTELNLDNHITTPELTEKLIKISDSSLRRIIPLWRNREALAMPQEKIMQADASEPSYSRKLTKEDGIIDWSKSAQQIEREIRAYIEWPKSRTKIADLDVVITAAQVDQQQRPSGLISVENKQLFIGCGQSSIQVLMIKPAGKKEMTAAAFLAGYGQRLQ